jgi:hypothetical protein
MIVNARQTAKVAAIRQHFFAAIEPARKRA